MSVTPAPASRRADAHTIGIVIPARNEEALIGACIEKLHRAMHVATLAGHRCSLHVVCDACDDGTEAIVLAAGHVPIVIDARNVGAARAYGAFHALSDGAMWLAFTDADSEVDERWLVAQLELQADVVCGTIQVDDWGEYGAPMRLHFAATYRDVDDHRHIHGANLGMSAEIYGAVGGFDALANGEDVALVRALEAHGARVCWSAAPRVVTSTRRAFRATEGFGATLQAVHARMAMVAP